MRKLYFIISVLVLNNIGNTYCKKTCKYYNDCMTISSCPEAARLAEYRISDETINKKFISSVCGAILVGKRISAQVCCSDFAVEKIEPLSHLILNSRTANGVHSSQISYENNFTNHNNIRLLPDKCGKYLEDRIIGGEFAHIYEFPWMALISFIEKTVIGFLSIPVFRVTHTYVCDVAALTGKTVSFGCGGSIISSKYILTAAHCVHKKVIGGVRLGEYDVRTAHDCEGEYPTITCEDHLQDVAVEKPIIHKDFRLTPEVVHDIALLRVKNEINFAFRNVAPICLPIYREHHNLKLSGKKVLVAGWGTTESGITSLILKKVSVQVQSDATSTENQQIILAGSTGRDSCQGDSGGPLMHLDEYNNTQCVIQFGVVSFGPALCGTPFPAAYTDVRKYMRWILDNIEE